MITQKTIVELQKGTEEAYEDVFHEYKKLIYYTINKVIRNADDTEMYMYDTFQKIFHLAPKVTFYDIPSFRSWCVSIARNMALDHVRNSKKDITIISEEIVMRSFESTDKSELDIREELICILGEENASIVIYYLYCEMTYREIGELLGLKADTVHKRYKKAINDIREHRMKYDNCRY